MYVLAYYIVGIVFSNKLFRCCRCGKCSERHPLSMGTTSRLSVAIATAVLSMMAVIALVPARRDSGDIGETFEDEDGVYID